MDSFVRIGQHATVTSVMIVHPSDEPYGSDRVVLRLARGLVERGRQVAVLLPDDQPPGWLTERLTESDIAVVRGPLAPARRRYLAAVRLLAYPRSVWRARDFIRREAVGRGVGIIHLNTSSLLVGLVLGRPAGARLVWHVHEMVLLPRLLGWVFRVGPLLGADRVIAVSHAVARHLGRFGRAKVRVVWNGIEHRPAPPRRSRNARITVAFVGRLNRWKGYEVFVTAAQRVAHSDPSARFLMAGDPPAGEEWRAADLARRVADAGIADRVRILGRVDDAAHVFEAAGIVAVPSTWPDPCPLVILEAMQTGCAVVASAHGGALELVEEGRTGLLVPPNDAVALAEAILGLVRDPQLRRRLGDAARRRVADSFTVERFLDGVEAVYAELDR